MLQRRRQKFMLLKMSVYASSPIGLVRHLVKNITDTEISSVLPTGATDIQSPNGSASSGGSWRWVIPDQSGGTVNRDIALRGDRANTTAIAHGQNFQHTANASFDYAGATFNSSTPGYPDINDRRETQTFIEPDVTVTWQIEDPNNPNTWLNNATLQGGDTLYSGSIHERT